MFSFQKCKLTDGLRCTSTKNTQRCKPQLLKLKTNIGLHYFFCSPMR